MCMNDQQDFLSGDPRGPSEPDSGGVIKTANTKGHASFAFSKVVKIALLLTKDKRNEFWSHLADMVHTRSRGTLGRELANVKIALGRSQRHSTTQAQRLMAERDAAQIENLQLKMDVQVLRSVLTRAMETMHAARTNHPWRHTVDEVFACCRIALNGTNRKPAEDGKESAA